MSSEIIFTNSNGATWNPGCGRERPVLAPIKLGVISAESEGGEVYAYTKGVNVKTHPFEFVQLTKAKADELLYWFSTICVGPRYPFVFIDEEDESHVVHWIDTEFTVEEISSDVYRASFKLREEI